MLRARYAISVSVLGISLGACYQPAEPACSHLCSPRGATDCFDGEEVACLPQDNGCLAVVKTGNVCEGGPDPACSGDPIQIGIEGLSQETLTRDVCQPLRAEAVQACEQQAAQAFGIPDSGRYRPTVRLLAARVGIDLESVPTSVVDELGEYKPFGGGFANHDAIFLDGKLLDVLRDVANFLATSGPLSQAQLYAGIDNIVLHHASVEGFPAPMLYPTHTLPAQVCGAADGFFFDMAGAILYHEFGHHWAYGCVDQWLMQGSAAGVLFPYPSKMEDDADIIAGALTRKAGHDLQRAQLTFDLLTFLFGARNWQYTSLAQAQSYEAQFTQTNPSYSPPARRHHLIAQGYELYDQSGSIPLPVTLQGCMGPDSDAIEIGFGCNGMSYLCGSLPGTLGGCCHGDPFSCPETHPFACPSEGLCYDTNTCGDGAEPCFMPGPCGP